MSNMPKPQPCGQQWLEMTPTCGGRICGQCHKVIVDFTKMRWKEIERLQQQHNHSICGMYHPKQLEYWGQEIPAPKKYVSMAATITSLTLSLALPNVSQAVQPADSIIVKGRVTDKETGEHLPFASVKLRHSKASTLTDIKGYFTLVLDTLPKTPFPDTLEVVYFGYQLAHVDFEDLNAISNVQNNIKLEDDDCNHIATKQPPPNRTYYSVSVPTRKERLKWKIKQWFRWKK